MKTNELSLLDLAVRVYPAHKDKEPHFRASKKWRCPDTMLVFDTETRTDETQRLTFGSYRFFKKGTCLREALFFGDDLPESDRAVLEKYVATHKADTARRSQLQLLARDEFVEQFFEDAYRARCLVVAFNWPFDLSRVATPVMLRKDANNKKDRWSQHGLGHLLNPADHESDDRDWIGQVWLNILRRALGLKAEKLEFENLPAVGRTSVSSPAVMRAFKSFNEGKCYADCIKPFNFVLTCQVAAFGHPTGANPERFHLIAPYNPDSRVWLKRKWIDQYTGKSYRITTEGYHGGRKTARVKTYGEILREYEFHPESKCADADGNTCGKQTVGLLARRHVQIDWIRYIGKESNALEAVEAGLIHSADAVYTEYCNQQETNGPIGSCRCSRKRHSRFSLRKRDCRGGRC
jgi:hypothetical protein